MKGVSVPHNFRKTESATYTSLRVPEDQQPPLKLNEIKYLDNIDLGYLEVYVWLAGSGVCNKAANQDQNTSEKTCARPSLVNLAHKLSRDKFKLFETVLLNIYISLRGMFCSPFTARNLMTKGMSYFKIMLGQNTISCQ